MRLLVLAIVAIGLCAPATSTAGSASSTSLRVTYWEDGSGAAPDAVWTLRCNPAGGSLRQPARACRRLAAGGVKLFAPLPKNIVCTEIYGGPQRARVVGVLAGRRIWASFARTNGCEIGRWQQLSPWLLPPGGVT